MLKRERRPQTPPRRAFWGNDLEGTNTGTFIARTPKRRGAAGLGSFLSLVGESREPARREWDEPPASQPDPNARLAFALRNRFFNRFSLCWARSAGVGGERGHSTRFSNHHQVTVRRQPRGSFGINAWLQTELPTAGASPALGVGGLRRARCR